MHEINIDFYKLKNIIYIYIYIYISVMHETNIDFYNIYIYIYNSSINIHISESALLFSI